MPSVEHLINGFNSFKATVFRQRQDIIIHSLQQGLRPSTLVVTGCELRMSPDMITSSNPGELYTVRNVGGLIPPKNNEYAVCSMAAIEYAICDLEVENVIILGNRYSSAIRMLLDRDDIGSESEEHIDPMKEWLSIAYPAKKIVIDSLPDAKYEQLEDEVEKQVILLSIKNLIEYEWVRERLEQNTLKIFGWRFDITSGSLQGFDSNTRTFEPIA
ncbi:MAG: hypothetical protein MK137_02940 [Rickettsiales bacterium]|nr:hypothetical protein [Rickettsiales bacterium]